MAMSIAMSIPMNDNSKFQFILAGGEHTYIAERPLPRETNYAYQDINLDIELIKARLRSCPIIVNSVNLSSLDIFKPVSQSSNSCKILFVADPRGINM